MSDNRYNGWTNYETWAVKLWMDNDKSEYDYWSERTREVWSDTETGGNQFAKDHMSRARIALSGELKSYYDDDMSERGVPELQGVYADLLNAALGSVDWYEIAQALIDDEELKDNEPDNAESAS
jgi:hypothetical protein